MELIEIERLYMADRVIQTAIMIPQGLFAEPELRECVAVAFSRGSFAERVQAVDAICGAI